MKSILGGVRERMESETAARWQLRQIGREIVRSAAFLTILPLGTRSDSPPNFRRAARAFPIVGALVGALGGVVILLATALGLPPLAAALLGVGATIAVTGGLHEDGLADTLDGFGGGRSAVSRLDIMRDSRIGTYGALALIGSVGLRAALIADWLPGGAWHAAFALIAAESVGRGAIVWIWASLPPARADGLAASIGAPTLDTRGAALLVTMVIGIVAGALAGGVLASLVALAAAALATLSLAAWSRRMIGGQTGDVLGAGEQIAMLAYLLALTAFA